MSAHSRFAVYWVPAREHPLWAAGSAWLGRDAERPSDALPHREATEAPRRYGFHATLKAPMRLREGVTETLLLLAVQAIATDTRCFAMPRLAVCTLDRFIALRPAVEPDAAHPLRILADRCVVGLDRLRATPGDPIERRIEGLDARRAEQARSLGYPYVLDDWRFHMTLSDPIVDDPAGRALRTRMLDDANAHFAEALRVPLVAEQIAVFVECGAGQPFVLTRRFALGA